MPRKIKKINLQLDLFDKEHNKRIIEKVKTSAETRAKAQERLNKILERHKSEIIVLSNKSISEQQEIIKKNLHNYVLKKNIKASDLKNIKISKIITETNEALFNLKNAHDFLKSESESLENYKKSKHVDFNSLREYENDITYANRVVMDAYNKYLNKLTKLVVEFRKDGVFFKYK